MVPGSYLPTRCEDPWGARSISFRDGGGSDLDLIVEVHRKLTPMNSIVLAEALAPFNLYFLEDPIQIDSIVSQAEIARRIHGPLGNGERLPRFGSSGNCWPQADLGTFGRISP